MMMITLISLAKRTTITMPSSPYDANTNTNHSTIKCRVASDKSGGGGWCVIIINLVIKKRMRKKAMNCDDFNVKD